MLILRFIGGLAVLALLLILGFFADAVWNGSRLFYAAMGRDRLVQACTPLTKEKLIDRGFSPTDLVFGERASIAFVSGSFGRARTLADDFTFSDGPDGQRVDGTLVCAVSGKQITVDISVNSLPLRAT